MNHLLRRQLKKLGLSEESAPDVAGWRAFLDRVQHTYADANKDRYTLERSLMTSSHEVQEVYDELRRTEANFKMLVEGSPDAVFVHDEGRVLYANPAMARLLGHETAAELIGRNALDVILHSDDRDALPTYYLRRDAGDSTAVVRLRWLRHDGATIVVEARGIQIDFDGRPATLVVARDVTERLLAQVERERVETSLRLSEERYRILFDGSPLPIMVFDPETLRILAVNERAVQLYGYGRAEFVAMTMTDLKLSEEVPELLEGMSGGYVGGPKNVGIRTHRKKDGTLMQMSITAHAVMLDGRRAILAINTDVTDTQRLEERLRQAQKMEAVGQLAGGIAHDFNNILAVILIDARMAQAELDEAHPVCEDLRSIETAALRAATLTRQLLTFSRKQPFQPQVLALNSVVIDLEKMLGRIIGEDIRVSPCLASDLGAIETDPSQMDQVLMNLVVNARDAMPSGGTLTIETSNVNLSAAQACDEGVAAGRYVMLAVTDTGAGMDVATRARIFEPFFTTKAVGKGSGLGLATVFGIVKQSGGGISVSSELGRGTTFKLYFPRVDAPSVRPIEPMEVSAPEIARGTETVLVVEDEEQVRRVVIRMLRSLGYTVAEARNANAAFDVLRERGTAVQLVLTDLVMPDIDGRTMVAQMRERDPNIKVLYMSGYTDHPAVKGEAAPMLHFIHKPFTAQQMGLALRRALEGRRTSSSGLGTVRVQ